MKRGKIWAKAFDLFRSLPTARNGVRARQGCSIAIFSTAPERKVHSQGVCELQPCDPSESPYSTKYCEGVSEPQYVSPF